MSKKKDKMSFNMKYLLIFGFVFLSVNGRRIHKAGQDTREIQKNFDEDFKDDHEAIEKVHLDKCKDCHSSINKEANSKSKKIPKTPGKRDVLSSVNGETKRHTKQSIQSSTDRQKRTHKKRKQNRGTKRTRPKKKHGKQRIKDVMVPDVTDNASEDRWRKQKLKQLPGVARLEQRLHPTVRNPIHNLMASLNRILQIMKDSVTRVDVDHRVMFDATRHEIMMGVRQELKNIADENDKAYDAVLQASLLTKDIYRRAHRERQFGPRTLPAAVSSDTVLRLQTIPLRERYMLAREELQRANRLKHRITLTERERYELETRVMQVQRQVEGSLPARTLRDLVRISNHTIRVLQTFNPTIGTGGRIHLYGHMYKTTIENVRESRDMLHDAKNVLTQTKSQITMGRSLRNQILRRSRDGSAGTMADMPFDDSRMMLWAAVDSARHHADNLVKTAADLHMKLAPILQKAKEVLADRDKNTISRRIEETSRTLENQILTLVSTMDKIAVEIDNDDILRSRCEAKGVYDDVVGKFHSHDAGIIDCDKYLPDLEGSGVDENLEEGSGVEGSGDLVDEDIIIPLTRPTEGANAATGALDKHTKMDKVILNKENVTIKGVTTDDEDMLSKKTNPVVTTTPLPSSVEPLIEEIDEKETEDGDFTFTDWFGLLGDDPNAGGSNVGNKLNTLILERLSVFSKDSVEVFATTDKIKEALEDLQSKWNVTKRSFEDFENNVLATKVFLHKWAAKNQYFSAVHDRVISLRDHMDLQSEVIERQCTEAVATAERKLEAAEERQARGQHRAETAADPEVVKEAVDAVGRVKEEVQEIVQLKRVIPDPCGSMQNLDNALRTNISELRQNIAKAKEIASSLQVPVSLQGDGYLTLPLNGDDTKTSRMTLSMNVKPGSEDGPIAIVRTEESGSVVVSVDDSSPVLTVLDKDDYDIGETTLDVQFESNTTYDVTVERLGSLFSMFVYSIIDNSVLANQSLLVDSVDRHQIPPTSIYIAGAPDNYPTFGPGTWQGCLSHVSINGKYLNLLRRHSGGNMTRVCSDMSFGSDRESLVLGGTGYARLALEPISSLSRGAMDNILIQFKAYTDGDLLRVSSSRTRSLESVQIDRGRIRLDFRNHYGEVFLQSKDGFFSYGKEHVLQITVKPSRQLELDVSLDANTDLFERLDTSRAVEKIEETALYIGGVPSSVNRSLAGCIRKLILNEEDATFLLAEEAIDVYRGKCVEPNCVKFVKDSLPLDLGEGSKRNSIEFSFAYGSKGTILEYSKEEKVKLTVTVDTDGLDISEAVGDVSKHLNIGNHSEGEKIAVGLKATKDEVEVTADGASTKVSYDSDCGWFCGSEEDKEYSIILGGTSEDTARFEGNLINFFMNGRPLDSQPFMESNNLQRCVPPRKSRKPKESEVKDIGRSVC